MCQLNSATAVKSIIIEHILQQLRFRQLCIKETDLTWKVLLNTQRKANYEFSGVNIYSKLSEKD